MMRGQSGERRWRTDFAIAIACSAMVQSVTTNAGRRLSGDHPAGPSDAPSYTSGLSPLALHGCEEASPVARILRARAHSLARDFNISAPHERERGTDGAGLIGRLATRLMR